MKKSHIRQGSRISASDEATPRKLDEIVRGVRRFCLALSCMGFAVGGKGWLQSRV